MRVADEIRYALLEASEGPIAFPNWQRIVTYKYSLDPLSLVGSTTDPAGGRFNIGDINPAQFLPFPGLYLAEGKNTALQEYLSQRIDPDHYDQALDHALHQSQSISIVSISVKINSLLNLRHLERLQELVDIIGAFTFPDKLIHEAVKIGLDPPGLIQSIEDLGQNLLRPNWRYWPMQFDVPHTSQIFGQLVTEAGIEGILYPSKFNDRDCLVVFPQNFEPDSDSMVALDDPPPDGTQNQRLDASIWAEMIR